MKQLSVIIIGAGNRGTGYSRYMKALPDRYKIVGMADPVEEKRRFMRDEYGVAPEMCFTDCRTVYVVIHCNGNIEFRLKLTTKV